MNRLLVPAAAVCLCAAALSAERPMIIVGDTARLTPITAVKCLPLYEIKAVRMDICRQHGDGRQKLVTTATVVQNKTDDADLIVTLSLTQNCLPVKQPQETVRVPRTRKGEAITIRFVSVLSSDAPDTTHMRMTPGLTFQTASPEDRP